MLGAGGATGVTISMLGAVAAGTVGSGFDWGSKPTLAGGGPSLTGGGGIFFGGFTTGSGDTADGAQPGPAQAGAEQPPSQPQP
jgi:hypothetical protein